jgi:hypothetical protein
MADDFDDDEEDIPQVASSENDMILIARALTAPHQYDVWGLIAGARTMPAKIGPTAAGLIGDAFSQIWPALWKRDGARPGASVTNGGIVRGRGWERHSPPALKFTTASIAILRWMIANGLAGSNVEKLPAQKLALGDQIVIYLALDITAGTPAQTIVARQPFVRAAPLVWLGYANLMAAGSADPPAFDELVTGVGAIVVEALQRDFAERWRAVELGKRSITEPEALVALGAAQDATLTGFMAACDKAGRRDLAGWVLDAALPQLERGVPPIPTDLDPTKPLSLRAAARNAAGALLRGVAKWQEWDDRHRGVRFLDDDYQAAQLLLARFERVGRAGVDRNAAWLAELAALPTLAAPGAPPSATVDRP